MKLNGKERNATKPWEDILGILQAIYIPFNDRGTEHTFPCKCGGTITGIRNTYNGHLYASCDKCGFKIME